jgi:hypothetical protein
MGRGTTFTISLTRSKWFRSDLAPRIAKTARAAVNMSVATTNVPVNGEAPPLASANN